MAAILGSVISWRHLTAKVIKYELISSAAFKRDLNHLDLISLCHCINGGTRQLRSQDLFKKFPTSAVNMHIKVLPARLPFEDTVACSI